MGDKSKLSLDLPEKRKTPPTCLPDLSQVPGVVTPLAQPLTITPCMLTAEDIQKIGVATPDMEKLFLNMNGVVSLSTTSTPSKLASKSFSSDKEDFCKGLLQSMEANIKNRSDSSVNLPFSDTDINSTSAAVDIIRSVKTASSVKLPLTGGNHSAIILPSSSFNGTLAATMSNLISTSSNALPLVRTTSGIKIPADFLNPVHSAFGSPYPVAIVPPQPQHVNVMSKPGGQIVTASAVFGAPPKLKHASDPVSACSSRTATLQDHCMEFDTSAVVNQRFCLTKDPMEPSSESKSLLLLDANNGINNIDMDDQEVMKRERKRLRNRIAATKCRQKKIAKIQTFEEQIKDLKRKHEDLLIQKANLKEKTALLKDSVLYHVRKGCNVIIAPLALTE